MNDYYKVIFTITPFSNDEADILSSFLSEIGYDSFETVENGLNAYIKKELYNQETTSQALLNYPFNSAISISSELIPGKNWNEEWEKNYFKPMIIGERCVIHSSFHKDFPHLEYEIVIDPKMAFGTGHHETTSLMVEQILDFDMTGKTVLDMGAGTGILSILCSQRGAENVDGIEIDPGAQINAQENIALNNVSNVDVKLGDASLLLDADTQYDIVLANINRNIILQDLPNYARVLKSKGYMFLSGFYTQDSYLITDEAIQYNLNPTKEKEKNNWAMLVLRKS